MRLWTVHPRHLDPQGLVALWREALLAQRVLEGATRGYRHHPQLLRFRDAVDPLGTIAAFLGHVASEAQARGYRFDAARIRRPPSGERVEETDGQLGIEVQHLRAKLASRSPGLAGALPPPGAAQPHPLFRIVPGPPRPWERLGAARRAPSGEPSAGRGKP